MMGIFLKNMFHKSCYPSILISFFFKRGDGIIHCFSFLIISHAVFRLFGWSEGGLWSSASIR